MSCVVVETERLLIRTWNDQYPAAVADMYRKPEVMEFIPGGVWDLDRTVRTVSRMRELEVAYILNSGAMLVKYEERKAGIE
jgi:hypothetical protein